MLKSGIYCGLYTGGSLCFLRRLRSGREYDTYAGYFLSPVGGNSWDPTDRSYAVRPALHSAHKRLNLIIFR